MEIDSVCSHQSTRHAHAATAKPSNIRISPAKIRDSQVTRKSLKPFSSSMLHEKKKIPTKEDILKINSKIELIKSKCMKTDAKLGRTDSRKTLSESVSNELNESVDIESEDATNTTKKINKMHLLRSKYADRPATIFFMYPKCCGISDANLERTFSIEDA